MEVRANRTRVYFREQDGQTITLDRTDQIDMAYRCELTTDASWDDVNVKYAEALAVDWGPGGFSEAEINSAYFKLKYLTQLDKHDAKERARAKVIALACEAAREEHPELPEVPPSVDSIKRWDYRWLASGRDIRVLADRHQDRGTREPRADQQWVTEILLEAIEKKMLQEPYFTPKQLEDYVTPIVAAKAKAENLPLDPCLGKNRYFGVHRIATLYAELNQEERLRRKVGKTEAARQAKGTSNGPSGDMALHEVEADHHQMDIEVRLPDGKVWGRPWLTVIFDRYSRMVLGYYLTMEPPSWFSVLMALRMAVIPKGEFLKSLNYDFTFDWRCWGCPDFLFVDRGAEFRSLTMKAAMSALNIIPVDVPRARGDLKGKIERWFGIFANGEVSKLPGYIGNSPKRRLKERTKAGITMAELNLVCAVFIVDIYNNRRHGVTKEWPSKRYTASVEGGMMDKLPPPPQLIGPATSKAVTGKLTPGGVLVQGSLYDSAAVRKLWHKHGKIPVLCRPDEADATRMLVHDGGRKFLETSLSGKYKGQKITRAELALLREADNDMTETPEDHQRQLQAQGNYNRLIDGISPKPRKVRRGHIPTTPVQHVVKAVLDRKGSAGPLIGYDPDSPIAAELYEPSGNYAGPTVTQQVFEGTLDEDTAWNFSRPEPGSPLGLPPPEVKADPTPPAEVPSALLKNDEDDTDDGIMRL